MHTVSRKIFGRYVSLYLTISQMKTLPFYLLIFLSRDLNYPFVILKWVSHTPILAKLDIREKHSNHSTVQRG